MKRKYKKGKKFVKVEGENNIFDKDFYGWCDNKNCL